MSSSPFPALPISQVVFPNTPLVHQAYAYAKKYTNEATLNHSLRSAAFSLLLSRKIPHLAADTLDIEAVVLSTILHDMGWAQDKSLVSTDKRFEVDGADITRSFIKSSAPESWDKHRLQLVWDAIALHTTTTIARFKEPEVVLTQLGISSDFFGVNIPIPGNVITIEEYKEIVGAFPRADFKNELIKILCGFCRDKPTTTLDNFVSEFGLTYGTDGQGGGKEEFKKAWEQTRFLNRVLGGLDACAEHED